MKEPNFDRDKKLVEFKHQTKRYDYETFRSEFDDYTTRLTTMNITDIIVVDEKAKKMYVMMLLPIALIIANQHQAFIL